MTIPTKLKDSGLYDALDLALRPVGFQAEQPPFGAGKPDYPFVDFVSTYARVHLAWCEPGAISRTGAAAIDLMDARLEADAKSGKQLDGYVILALPAAPTEQEQPSVRQFESERLVCRRQVIWPTPPVPELTNVWAEQIARVTVSDLPQPIALSRKEREAAPEASVVQWIEEQLSKGDRYGPIAEKLRQKAENDVTPAN